MQKRITNLCFALLACCALSACGSQSGNKPSAYVNAGGKSELKIGKPYKIEGRTYVPEYNPTYSEVGVASWYGPGFHGRATANGERFNQNSLTAAHRTLPLPCLVRVTNMENNKVAIVKVNDRGPFAKNRILDLSKGSAKALGVIGAGTAQVKVEYLHDETRQMITDLIRGGQLNAKETDLATIDMGDAIKEASVTEAKSKGILFGLISSAEASTSPNAPQAAVMGNDSAAISSAPLSPIASRDLEVLPASTPLYPPVPLPVPEQEVGSGHVQLASLSEDKPRKSKRHTTKKAKKASSVAVAKAKTVDEQGVFIQAAALGNQQNANKLAKKLSSMGHTSINTVEINGRVWYRVRLGPIADTMAANNTLSHVRDMGLPDARLVSVD